MSERVQFILRADDAVHLTVVVGEHSRGAVSLSPRFARQLAQNLDLYAEKAEIIAAQGDHAAVGPRVGAIGSDGAEHA